MEDGTLKILTLADELSSSKKLIIRGFSEIQKIGGANDFYHLPFQLLTSGIERLMKCHICLGVLEKTTQLPNSKELKDFGGHSGHDLIDLKNEILGNHFNTPVPLLVKDQQFLNSNTDLLKVLDLLSEFGKFARYHNLDVITQHSKPSRDVVSEWRIFEQDILERDRKLISNLGEAEYQKEIRDFLNRHIIMVLERFVAALSRQFTLGKLGAKAQQLSPIVFDFITLFDSKLGTKNYSLDPKKFDAKKIKKRSWLRRFRLKFMSNIRFLNLNKNTFEGDWPFYDDEVLLECHKGHWCIVVIDGYEYGLNGSGTTHFNLYSAHEAGVAILGVSIQPFIKMILSK